MTKEEFIECMKISIEELEDPEHELHKIVREGNEMARDVREHDHTFAQHIENVTSAIADMIKHVRSKGMQ